LLDELNPLEFPPIPPLVDEVDLEAFVEKVPLDWDVVGLTVEPVVGLF
jgi:hypothetical protein